MLIHQRRGWTTPGQAGRKELAGPRNHLCAAGEPTASGGPAGAVPERSGELFRRSSGRARKATETVRRQDSAAVPEERLDPSNSRDRMACRVRRAWRFHHSDFSATTRIYTVKACMATFPTTDSSPRSSSRPEAAR